MVSVMIVRMRMMMVDRVDSGAAHVMVMALLRRPDRVLVADDPGAVFAQLAVHLGIARGEPGDALDKGVDHPGMVAQITRLDEFNVGKARRDLVGLGVDALDQDPG